MDKKNFGTDEYVWKRKERERKGLYNLGSVGAHAWGRGRPFAKRRSWQQASRSLRDG